MKLMPTPREYLESDAANLAMTPPWPASVEIRDMPSGVTAIIMAKDE